MIIVSLESFDQGNGKYSVQLKVLEMSSTTKDEIEMLASIVTSAELLKDQEFLLPDQYQVFVDKVIEEYDSIVHKINTHVAQAGLWDRRN